MNSFMNLVRAFRKSVDMSRPMDRGQKIKVIVLSVFSVCFIFLPVLLITGLMVKLMTESLMTIGFASFGIQFMFHVICFFSVIFGINVVFSEFYFSNDIEFILPFPLRASQIVGAKFVSVFLMENVMQFLFVISCIVGYGIGARMNFLGWMLSIIGILTLPVLPLAYCGIISILLMAFTRLIKNKDVIQKISVGILFALVVVLVASIGTLQNLDLGEAIGAMAQNDQGFIHVLNLIFPNIPLFVETFTKGNLLALAGYILVNMIAVGMMLLLAELFYFKSVVGLDSAVSSAKQKSMDKILLSARQHSPAYAYFMKELRILIRTPAYLTNCVGINFIWPVFVYAMYKISGNGISLVQLRERYAQNDISLQLIFLLGGIGLAVLLSSLNSICSNAISREGKHFSFMKYIPVSYAVQWNVKVLVGVMFSAFGVLIFYLPACVAAGVPVWQTMLFVILILMGVSFVSYMGIYIDSIQPKLVWDDELGSLRENYNSFFSMAIAIAFVAVVCVGGFFFFRNAGLSIGSVSFVLFMILLMANAVILRITVKSGAKNIMGQEEM